MHQGSLLPKDACAKQSALQGAGGCEAVQPSLPGGIHVRTHGAEGAPGARPALAQARPACLCSAMPNMHSCA